MLTIKQTNPYFKNNESDIYYYGCLFMVLLATSGHENSPQAIVATYKQVKQRGLLGAKCRVLSYDKLLELVGSNYRHGYRFDLPNTSIRNYCYDFAIRRIVTATGHHFVLLGTDGEVVYDPYAYTGSGCYTMACQNPDRIDLLKAL